MHDGIVFPCSHGHVKGAGVTHGSHDHLCADRLAHAMAGRHVINNMDLVSLVHEVQGHMAADVSGSSGDQISSHWMMLIDIA
jgi:hypothetical protein